MLVSHARPSVDGNLATKTNHLSAATSVRIKFHPKPRVRGRLMTVCVAALAGDSMFITCISDMALSFGDRIEWDADSSKMTTFDNWKTVIMMAGNEGPTSRVLRKLEPLTAEWRGDRNDLMQLLEDRFKEAFAEEQEITVLHPQMMTRQDYLNIIAQGDINRHIEALAQSIERFQFDCALLVCGFDKSSMPYIILLQPPGIAMDCAGTGFAAIGTGAEKATSCLLFNNYARLHGVSRSLYDCFDAKVFAEMAPGVGYEWEMKLISMAGAVPVHKDTKPLLEKVWHKYCRSPFEKRKKEDLPDPPRDWQMQLRTMVAASIQQCDPKDVKSINEIAEGR
jgi:hypothetical protein